MIQIKQIRNLINFHYDILQSDKELLNLIADHLNKFKKDYNNFYNVDLFDNIKRKYKFKTLYIKFLILSDIASILTGDLYYHDRNFEYQRNLMLIVKNSKFLDNGSKFFIEHYNKNSGISYCTIKKFILKPS